MSQIERHTFEDNQPSISQHMVCRPSARNITGNDITIIIIILLRQCYPLLFS